MKKSISFYTILVALSAFVGVICDGIAAKTPMGSFYVTNGVTGATGASASAEWLANHSGATLEDYWNFLRMKPTGSVESCNDLPSSANVGDMYLVKDGSNTRMCVYYETGFPACPSGCGLMNAAQGPDGADGCDPDVTLAPSTADNRCYVLTVTNKTRGANGCETSGTPQTQTVCHGDDGKDACFLQQEVSVMANSGQVDTGCKQEQRKRGVLQSNGTCDTTGYNWENFGDPRCPACEVQTQTLSKDTKGCVQKQKQNGTRNSTTHLCEYSGTWDNDGAPLCDACPDHKVQVNNGARNANNCFVYDIYKQKRNTTTNVCESEASPYLTNQEEGCLGTPGTPGAGVCDLSAAEKQLNDAQQTAILSARIKTRTKGTYTAPTWNSTAGYHTSFGYYTETSVMCNGTDQTNSKKDSCQSLHSGGDRTNASFCADGMLYRCDVPAGETVSNATNGQYYVCIVDASHKPIQPSCVTEESAYDVPSSSQTITGIKNGNSANLTFYANVGKTRITKTNNCTGGNPEVIDTEDKCYENTTDTDLIMTDTSATYRGYTCYTCVRSGGNSKGSTYEYCRPDQDSASHKIKEKIDAVNTELSGNLAQAEDAGRAAGAAAGAAAVSDNDLVDAVVNFVRASCFDSLNDSWSSSGACGAVPGGVRSSVQNYSRN